MTEDIYRKLVSLQLKLSLTPGGWSEELPEQKLITRHFKGDEIVLEIGGNIGRASLITSSILKDSSNLVTLESSPFWFKFLKENRDKNNFNFHIVNKALSKHPLVQRNWITRRGEPEGDWKAVEIIDLDSVRSLVSKPFDTLIIDCEGAFYNILLDYPEIMDGINLVIIENDFGNKEALDFVTETFIKHGLICLTSIPLERRYHHIHIPQVRDRFYEVWRRI